VTSHPRDAARLLLDPSRIRYACNFYANPSFSKAMANTQDWQGRILADEVTPTAVEQAAAWLAATVQTMLDGGSVELEPLRQGKVPKRDGGERVIWVASYRRRALSNLIAGVLEDTTTHLLRSHVRAYIPGAREAVKETILDVAEAVSQRKLVWYVNEDIRSCFDELPHSMIADALDHYGFSSEVRQLIMTSVTAPRWVGRPGGHGALVAYGKGIPMGTAESSVLANLAMFELDDALAETRGVVAQRYSDNVLIGAADKASATHAARVLMGWARRRGLTLKGLHHRASARTLVRDVRNRRISFLGAEVDHHGAARMPSMLLQERVTAVGEQLGELEQHILQEGLRFCGRSIYAHGVGTEVRSFDEIREQVVGFQEYWAQIHEPDAQRFRDIVEKRHPGLFRSADQPAAAWEASLGTQLAPGRETSSGRPSPGSWKTQSPTLPLALRATGGVVDGMSSRARVREHLHTTGTNDHSTDGQLEEILDELNVLGTGTHLLATSSGVADEVGDGDVGSQVRLDADVDEVDVDLSLIHPGRDSISQVVATPLDRPHGIWSGMVAEPDHADTPSVPAPDNSLHVHATRIRRSDGTFVVRVFGGHRHGSAVDIELSHTRKEVELVRAITRAVERAAAAGARALNIVTDAWLPRHLLSQNSSFRAPILFGEVVRLHRVAERVGVAVTLRSCAEGCCRGDALEGAAE
jgi:Reverse transcriptase (RNA-dependent DNA polymerase)